MDAGGQPVAAAWAEHSLTLEVGGITAVERSLVYLKQRGYFGLGV